MESQSTVAVLPAAGASRRMGRPKLLLPLNGGPLIAGVVNALLGAGVEEIVLVTAPEDEDLRGWARRSGIESAVNPDPGRGMLSSIRQGIDALGGAAELSQRGVTLLVSPADQVLTAAELQAAGVKRISLGVALYTHTMASLDQAAKALATGDLNTASSGMSFARLSELLAHVKS